MYLCKCGHILPFVVSRSPIDSKASSYTGAEVDIHTYLHLYVSVSLFANLNPDVIYI